MELRAGSRLRSNVCTTEAIVVRAGAGDIDLRCGGHPMISQADAAAGAAGPDPDFSGGTQMGKRYTDDTLGLEVLVTKPGAGSLSIGDALLALKDAKPLPSSD